MASEQDGDSTRKDGYSLELFTSMELPERFICILCNKVLRDTIRCPVPLGTRACLSCYKIALEMEHAQYLTRPILRFIQTGFLTEKSENYFVICENKDNGCNWSEVHILNSQFRRAICEHCRHSVVLLNHKRSVPTSQ